MESDLRWGDCEISQRIDLFQENMLKFSLLCCLLTFVISCVKKNDLSDLFVNFDANVKKTELYKLTIDSSKYLNQNEKCSLKQIIDARLSEIGSKVIVVYPYFIKNYYAEELDLYFSFLLDINNGQYHLISLPEVRNLMFDENVWYQETKTGELHIKDEIEKTRNIKIEIESVLKKNTTRNSLSHLYKIAKDKHELLEIVYYPYLNQKVSHDIFKKLIDEKLNQKLISLAEFENINKILQSELNNSSYVSIYKADNLGHILLFSDLTDGTQTSMTLLPLEFKKKILRSDIPKNFPNCE